MKPITLYKATMTSKGLIEHKRHPAGFLMPVMLEVGGGAADKHEFQAPMTFNGKILYALPNGGVST